MMLLLLAAAASPQSGSTDILIDRTRLDRTKPVVPSQPIPRSKVETVIAAKGEGTPITGIAFRGADAPAPLAMAARRYLGKPATPKVLQLLAADLSAAYGKSNIALYTIAIPEQDFSGGTVIVLLTEGHVARLVINAPEKEHSLLRKRLTVITRERPLSRTTFERQVLLSQAVPGLTFENELKDPEGTGALALFVTPKQKKRKATIGFSNRGIDLLGDGQFDGKVEFNGVATNGDQLSVNVSAASDLRRFRYGSLGYSAPLSASGVSVSATGAYLETRPKGFNVRGTARLAGLSVSYPLVRRLTRTADLSLGFDGLDSDNATFGNLIATERTRAIRGAGSYAFNGQRGGFSVNASFSRGLDVLGARVTRPLAQAGFTKGNLAASFVQQLGKRIVARISGTGQYTRNRLPAAERFAIGGEGTGRAFDASILSGDRGIGGSSELAFRPFKAAAFATSELYTFVDGGSVGILDRGVGQRMDYSLASTGAGVRLRYKEKAELGLEAARAIDDPYAGYGEDWRLSVSWRLSL
jgi:hemolysin activation/secretion protein